MFMCSAGMDVTSVHSLRRALSSSQFAQLTNIARLGKLPSLAPRCPEGALMKPNKDFDHSELVYGDTLNIFECSR